LLQPATGRADTCLVLEALLQPLMFLLLPVLLLMGEGGGGSVSVLEKTIVILTASLHREGGSSVVIVVDDDDVHCIFVVVFSSMCDFFGEAPQKCAVGTTRASLRSTVGTSIYGM
jgi:hypothetical protein